MKNEGLKARAPITIHVDGACKGNPGPASIGAVIRTRDGETLKSLSEYIGHATNNIAEYLALIFALQEAVSMAAKDVEVYTDSQLMARQFSGEYKVKEPHIRVLQRIVKQLTRYFDRCEVRHIPREENRDADLLANRAIEEHV